jgi:DNA-binding HxlR family transcriptional regulator
MQVKNIEYFEFIYKIYKNTLKFTFMKTDCNDCACPITILLSFISKKWVLLIMKSINEGCVSYTDIEKNLSQINPRILCSRLCELQEF